VAHKYFENIEKIKHIFKRVINRKQLYTHGEIKSKIKERMKDL
jgi:hypothetical protein